MIYRGTTPDLVVDVDGLDLTGWKVWVSVRSGRTGYDITGDRVTVTKTDSGCTCAVALTQEETLALMAGRNAMVQVRAVDSMGEAVATSICAVQVGNVLMGGVIADD